MSTYSYSFCTAVRVVSDHCCDDVDTTSLVARLSACSFTDVCSLRNDLASLRSTSGAYSCTMSWYSPMSHVMAARAAGAVMVSSRRMSCRSTLPIASRAAPPVALVDVAVVVVVVVAVVVATVVAVPSAADATAIASPAAWPPPPSSSSSSSLRRKLICCRRPLMTTTASATTSSSLLASSFMSDAMHTSVISGSDAAQRPMAWMVARTNALSSRRT
mmetsp:Transcript_53808/g.131868  ORF Transcript_53808/g.131868 Transcript_53808/m.131868 type:complete len:217 (-) Transcript_53808:848-1498(-)